MKWHGGKTKLAARIVALMPPHKHYVEPYAGGLAVLFARPLGQSEVVNDIDRHLMTFWSVLRNQPNELIRRLTLTAFGRDSLLAAQSCLAGAGMGAGKDTLEIAASVFICARQSFGAQGKTFQIAKRIRCGINDNISAWFGAVDHLPEMAGRLRSVVLENRPALDLIANQDGKDTLFYCDPPYLAETRASPNVYAHEMTHGQHAVMLERLLDCRGKVMLSGYRSALYDARLADWTRHDFDLPNHAAGGATKRRMTECLWTNF